MAFEGYMYADFQKQGKSKGESPRPKHIDKIPFLSIRGAVEAPRDVSTGKAQGKRFHRPLTILKEIGASTPQFFTACCSNEVLPKVTFEYWQKDPNGADIQHFQVTLTNAHVIKHEHYTGQVNTDTSSAATAKNATEYDTNHLEEISFSFDKIEHEHKLAKTMGADSWGATNQDDA